MSDELTFQIEGGIGEPTRVVTLTRADAGRVRVREWTSENWLEPKESVRDAAEVWREVERAAQTRRRVSADPAHIRQWLLESAPR
jgi:hypothetical protein